MRSTKTRRHTADRRTGEEIFFPARWDATVILWTCLYTLLFAAFAVMMLMLTTHNRHAPHDSVYFSIVGVCFALLMLTIITRGVFCAPCGYLVTAHELRIRRFLAKDVCIPLQDIEKVEPIAWKAAFQSRRQDRGYICLYGYLGCLTSRTLPGGFYSHVTHTGRLVVIERYLELPVIISPANIEAFIDLVRKRADL